MQHKKRKKIYSEQLLEIHEDSKKIHPGKEIYATGYVIELKKDCYFAGFQDGKILCRSFEYARYFGSYATADLKKIKEKLGKKGILFQAAAIGWDKEAIRKIYGNAYLDISSLEQLPIRLTKQLAKLLRRVN